MIYNIERESPRFSIDSTSLLFITYSNRVILGPLGYHSEEQQTIIQIGSTKNTSLDIYIYIYARVYTCTTHHPYSIKQ